jgi:integrase
MHNDFTLFLREIPGGKKVFYYYAYDGDGRRRGPWTTKCQKRTAARNFCHSLLKKGGLIPGQKKVLTFGDYADGFWERGSKYVENRDSRADITDSYLATCQRHLTNHILPFFAKTPLDKITEEGVNEWLLGFKRREVIIDGKTEIKGYKNTYANSVFGTFTLMMGEAVKRKLITQNPCGNVPRLKNDRKEREILTVDEVRKLFPAGYTTVWGDKKTAYAANRLASLTGMRIGEILGLKGEFVFDNYIHVGGQYTRYGYGPTKTKTSRKINTGLSDY